MSSINTWICIFIEFINIFLTFHTKNNHTLLSRVFHGMFSQTWCTSRNFGTRASCSRVWGLLPLHAFKLLMLISESFVQINQVDSVFVPWQKISMRVDKLCGITSGKKWRWAYLKENEVNKCLSMFLYCTSNQGEMHSFLDKVRKSSCVVW